MFTPMIFRFLENSTDSSMVRKSSWWILVCICFCLQIALSPNHLIADEPLIDNQENQTLVDEPLADGAGKQVKNRKKSPVDKTQKNKNQNASQANSKAEKKKNLKDIKSEGITDQELLDQVIFKLDLIEQNLAKSDGLPYKPVERKGKLQLLIETPGVQVVHHGSNQVTRVLGFYLVIANLNDQPVEFPVLDLKLNESGKEIAITELPASIKQFSVTMGDHSENLKNFDHNTILKVPPHGVARAFVVFHGLDQGNHIPKLVLSYPENGKQEEININRRELGLLNLTKKLIGPENCLLHLMIAGQSNMINSGSLIDELDAASSNGVTRTVIEWTKDAAKFDAQFQNWYKLALEQHYAANEWFNDQYPSFPSNIKELHFAFTSTDPSITSISQNNFSDRSRIYVHKNSLEACSAALRTAVEILSHDQIVALLESNEPASQVSVLAFASSKLDVEDLDLILPLLKSKDQGKTDDQVKSEDQVMIMAALSALSQIDHPDALKSLLTAVADSNNAIAVMAIQSLSNSKIIAYQDELLKLYEKSELPVQQKIVRLISANPHPKWLPVLLEQFTKGSAELRVEVLKAIGQINPKNLQQILLQAIDEPDQKIWDIALGLLMKTHGQQNEAHVAEKIYAQLEQGVVTSNMLTFISQTRDPRAQQLLFKQWKTKNEKSNPDISNPKVLSELLNMLDPVILSEITAKYDSLSEAEKSNYLRNYPQEYGDYQSYLSKWKSALLSENNSLNNVAQEVYRKFPDEQMFEIVYEALSKEQGEKPNNNRVSKYCNMLSQFGTLEARQALRKFRDQTTNEQSINYAENSLRNLYQNTPCYYFLYNARNHNENGKYATAMKQLDIAIKVDPDIPDFYLERARSRVGLDSFDKAIEDYRKVIEIEPKHRTVWALLADAFIEQREFKKAVETLDQALVIYPKDASLWNSRGHAYAMMENFEASLTNYLKALELDPNNSLAITGVALAETYLGRFTAGVDRVRQAQKNYPNDSLFAYNSACVYSRALEQLRKIPAPSPAQQQLMLEYRQEGLKELKNSINMGFANDDWIKKDPDLVTLANDDNSEFKELLKLAAEKKNELIKKKKNQENDE